jgi:hypothetical protein
VPIALLSSVRLFLLPLLLLVSNPDEIRNSPEDTPTAGVVVPTAAMSLARYAHTATPLADGRVLVLGGFTSEAQAAHSAEAYDPVAGRFRALPRMVTVRHSHTATVLPDGKVLIAGGYAAGSTTVANAELFDPARNTFTATGSLRAARAGHVAVLLKNGKVLIAGGVGPEWSFLSSAELYDPATGRFVAISDMTVARESHAAVRLQDGRVLIVGGHRGRRADIILYASAEVFDPSDNRFHRVGDMQTRRHKHDAVLLADGRVLVTGGSDERDNQGAYRSTEVFDPARGTFSAGSLLARPRYKHNGSSVLLPTGRVLIAGGAGEAEVLDPRTGATSVVPGATQLSGQFSAVAMTRSGQVLITGGYGSGQGPQSAAWVYRP